MADKQNFEELYNKEVEAHTETKQKLTSTEESLSSAEEALKVMSKKVNAPSSNKPAKLPVVKLKDGKFQFTTPTFLLNSVKYISSEACNDSELCEMLVSKNTGVLEPVE